MSSHLIDFGAPAMLSLDVAIEALITGDHAQADHRDPETDAALLNLLCEGWVTASRTPSGVLKFHPTEQTLDTDYFVSLLLA